jgi:SAM-dependent methyltransferase
MLKRTALPLYLSLRGAWYAGHQVSCPCCQRSFSHFLPLGVDRRMGQCPYCRSNERDRALWLYLDRHPDLISAGKRVLHIGPESIFYRRFKQVKGLYYTPADKFAATFESTYPPDTVYLDITHMPQVPDNGYDVILCSHVLEYIPDDHVAMRELRRVLRPDGMALLQVPLRRGMPITHEDASITSAAQRAQVFGDPGHIRYYGEDFAQRLSSEGLSPCFTPLSEEFSPEEMVRYGLVMTDDFHFCKKVA